MTGATKRATSTSSFGVSRRESHDAGDFYARFAEPVLSADDTVNRIDAVDWIHCGDARQLGERVPECSVALVVTSPPYFAGKAYEQALGEGHIPADYQQYLCMLYDVFAACATALEPGGRIAVNVANLGRKPYRSLASDVIRILQDDLGLLLRGEIVWRKGEGATGSCAWGSYQSASNPVLRDLTERVIVAGKGRFDRAVDRKTRIRTGLPHRNTITADDFMSWTTDVWDVPTESANRVGHPAPFPVELPQRLIELLTFEGDVVLDPFMGSGSTAVAALRTGRHFIGFDTDAAYAAAAMARVTAERAALGRTPTTGAPAGAEEPDWAATLLADAAGDGRTVKSLSRAALDGAGFTEITASASAVAGVKVSATARDATGRAWRFEVVGNVTRGSDRAGLRPTDAVLRTVGKAAAIAAGDPDSAGLVVLTTALPAKGTPGAAALRSVVGRNRPIALVVDLTDPDGLRALALLARTGELPTSS